ncbi:DUF1275 domain-containing protein [Streptococcus iniae]|uniref:YoaK family protein n=1 Tax=Streptococcus iniae TaxID=1346 RepID=UPI000EF7267A|nr:YoaK family protein [Streptococcus iniae]RLV42699.1 DUF1275 domain-containing protein [Streptococcus iniae]
MSNKSRKNRRKRHQVYEGIRCASALTFISGYVNAFTFVTQGRRFAGVQTGNVLYFAIRIAEKTYLQAFNFLLPIFFFMLGQSFTYFVHRWSNKHHLHWYLISSSMLTIIAILTSIMTPFSPRYVTVSALAFFASIQVDTFKSLRGASYANVMMTGNIKNAAYVLTKGLYENNRELIQIGRNTLIIIMTFVLGVICSTLLSYHFGEMALSAMLFPLAYVNYLLLAEHLYIQRKIRPIRRG